MAEGFARELGKGLIEPFSAGLMAAGLHPRAVSVMKEMEIDISGQKSKGIDESLLRKNGYCHHALRQRGRVLPMDSSLR